MTGAATTRKDDPENKGRFDPDPGSPDLAGAYARAARLTGPQAALRYGGPMLYGYWLDADHYFFVAEVHLPGLDRALPTPMLAEKRHGTARPAIGRDDLIDLLGIPVEGESDAALADAEFDMPGVDTLAVSCSGRSWLIDLTARRVRWEARQPAMSMLHSPDGRHGCFVRGNDLWLRDLANGTERPLTEDGEAFQRYGGQPETCLAAVSYRANPAPMATWSPDSRWVLTHRIDERELPDQWLVQHVPPGGGRPIHHRFKYPLPGDPLPVATFVAIHVETGRRHEFSDAPAPITISSPFHRRLAWFGSHGRSWFVRFDRYLKAMEMVMLDTADGSARIVIREQAESYVEPHNFAFAHPNIRVLEESGELVWFSEKTGWPHLYLHDLTTGVCKHALTAGPWAVRDIVDVDPERRILWYLASGVEASDDPLWRSLWCVSLDGGAPELVFRHAGDISVARASELGDFSRQFRPKCIGSGIAPGGGAAVLRLGDPVSGDRTSLVDFNSAAETTIAGSEHDENGPRARRFTVAAADGETRIHGLLFVPRDWSGASALPLIDFIYPGPQVTQVPQFQGSLKAAPARALAALGFAVMTIDTRGTPGRSRAFHHAGYGHLLEPQLADHAAAVRALCERHPWLDPKRVGIFGTSAGGAAAARALFDYGDVFKAGVAIAGNHDPALYISSWSDKFRGPPNDDWPDQANRAAAHRLAGPLMLVVGEMDQNVHPAHTLGLADALSAAGKDFEFLIVPNAGHDVMSTHGYALRRIWDFFVRHLLGRMPPAFDLEYCPEALARFAAQSIREIDL